MRRLKFTVNDPLGLHARPAGMLVKESEKYNSEITVTNQKKSADARHIFSLMSLMAKCGDTVTVEIRGSDENSAADGLEHFFKTYI